MTEIASDREIAVKQKIHGVCEEAVQGAFGLLLVQTQESRMHRLPGSLVMVSRKKWDDALAQ